MNAGDESQVLKKIYFIKQPSEGEELVTLLKNKFKTMDAIRDVIGWYQEGRDFDVALQGHEGLAQNLSASSELRYEVSRWVQPSDNNRSILSAIGSILNWLEDERPFDILLTPRASLPGGPGTYSLN